MAQSNNPNNYPGVEVGSLVGYIAGIAYPPYDKDGTRGYQQVSVAIDEGYKKDGQWVKTGTTWYRWEAHKDKIAELGLAKGDQIRIDDARQSVKEFGEGKLGITLNYGTVTILKKGNAAPAPAASNEGDYF